MRNCSWAQVPVLRRVGLPLVHRPQDRPSCCVVHHASVCQSSVDTCGGGGRLCRRVRGSVCWRGSSRRGAAAARSRATCSGGMVAQAGRRSGRQAAGETAGSGLCDGGEVLCGLWNRAQMLLSSFAVPLLSPCAVSDSGAFMALLPPCLSGVSGWLSSWHRLTEGTSAIAAPYLHAVPCR